MIKRGISTIVAMVLIVLVTVVGVAILWMGLASMLSVNIAYYDASAYVVMKGGYTFYDSEDESVTVRVGTRGEEIIDYVQIVLTMEDGRDLASVHDAPELNGMSRYYLDVSSYLHNPPVYVAVAPIFVVEGKYVLGLRSDKIKLPKRVEDITFYSVVGDPVNPIEDNTSVGGDELERYFGGDEGDCFGDSNGDSVYEICTCNDLQNIDSLSNLGFYYILMHNVDCSSTSLDRHPLNHDGEGFDPIGNNTNRFVGNFDGQGFEVANLYINRIASTTNEGSGLFGYVETGSEIKNLGMIDVNITGYTLVGGLVGINEGIVSNSYSSGYVADVPGASGDTGGLIGRNRPGALVNLSYSSVTVSASNKGGGLVGWNYATIQDSYATGDVSSIGVSAGGLVGHQFSTGLVNNSYATGDVAAGTNASGGLVGTNGGGRILDSFSTGDVTAGGVKVGGIVGNFVLGSITNSYWNSHAENPDDCYYDNNIEGSGNSGCFAISDNEVYFYDVGSSPMTEWDFESVWDNGNNLVDYPVLR
jgi:hypothetical protein